MKKPSISLLYLSASIIFFATSASAENKNNDCYIDSIAKNATVSSTIIGKQGRCDAKNSIVDAEDNAKNALKEEKVLKEQSRTERKAAVQNGATSMKENCDLNAIEKNATVSSNIDKQGRCNARDEIVEAQDKAEASITKPLKKQSDKITFE